MGATIRRDRFGVPHVEAGNEADAWFAMGFACAQDRLWQMEWYRLRGQGRWAEVAGPAGVEEDILFRRLGLADAARADVAAMTPATRAMFESYARGVNRFLALGDPLPLEVRLTGARPLAWEPWHSVLLFKVRHAVMGKIALKLARTELLRRAGPEAYARLEAEAPAGEPVILPPGGRLRVPPAADASNSWAVHGSRTTTGAPVLCNDSHRPLDVPNVYWQCSVAWPGTAVAGGAFPGFPAFPHFGFNGRVGWNITHSMADTQDLYLETFDRQQPRRYLTETGWREASITTESIEVRGAAPVPVEIVRTRHGAIIDGRAIALRTTTTDRPSRQWECLRPMLAAASVAELFEAQRGWEDPVNNLVAADRGGSIGYLTRGRLPIRPDAEARKLVVPGETGEHEWCGDVPFEEMPRAIDPPEGFVATANQRVSTASLPYVAAEFAPPGRAERIRELILAAGQAAPEQIAAMQADTVSVRARGWSRLLARSTPLRGDAERARALLAAWDGDLGAGSAAALLYSCFRQEMARAAFAPVVGAETWAWIATGCDPGAETLLERWLYDLGARGDATPAALQEALAAAWQRAAAATGTSDPRAWQWASVHRCAPRHPLSACFPEAAGTLDPPAFGLGGDNDTIRVASFSLASLAPAAAFAVRDVSVYRQVIDFAALRMLWSIPGGASGSPDSPHRDDQLDLWRDCRLVPASRSVEEALLSAVETLPLEVL